MLLLKMIMKSLKFNDYFEMSLLYDLIINLAICNSRNFTFINSIISTMRKSSIYKSTIAIILLLNNK